MTERPPKGTPLHAHNRWWVHRDVNDELARMGYAFPADAIDAVWEGRTHYTALDGRTRYSVDLTGDHIETRRTIIARAIRAAVKARGAAEWHDPRGDLL